MSSSVVVLGSRSPRRRDLLNALLSPSSCVVCPPIDAEELDFKDVDDEVQIEQRLLKIVTMKLQDVQMQLTADQQDAVVVVADTIVIATDRSGRKCVLGQPNPQHWQDEVRIWFRDLLSGTTHSVWTALITASKPCSVAPRIVRTEVSMAPFSPELIEWYISLGESPGKAGGYAIQGHAASFVCGLQGSLTNVIGLPVLELAESLREAGIAVHGHSAANRDQREVTG